MATSHSHTEVIRCTDCNGSLVSGNYRLEMPLILWRHQSQAALNACWCWCESASCTVDKRYLGITSEWNSFFFFKQRKAESLLQERTADDAQAEQLDNKSPPSLLGNGTDLSRNPCRGLTLCITLEKDAPE